MKNKAVYPGTFDPITYGHIDLISRAAKMFDQVVVAIAASVNKRPCFSIEERVELASEVLSLHKNVCVCGFDSLLMNFMREKQANIILRGLRAVSDFDYEFQLAGVNRQLNPNIESLFLMPAESYTYISSSFVREIAQMNGDVSKFVPAAVAKALMKKMKE